METRSPTAPAPGARPSWSTLRLAARCAWSQENDSRLMGFAILNPYFPGPNLTHSLFLKELYVTGDARSSGTGEALIEAIRTPACQRGDTRAIWAAGEESSGSQRFYDRLGMRREKKVYYVMDP